MKTTIMNSIGDIAKEIISSIIKLNIDAKLTLVSLLVIYPFWFISIYLFGVSFYNNNPIWITLIITFCLTITWHFTILQVTGLLSEMSFIKVEESDSLFLAGNMTNSMSFLSLFMYISYSNKWSFYKFTKWSFTSLLVLIVFFTILYIIIKFNKEKKANKENA